MTLISTLTAWAQTHAVWCLYNDDGLSFINGKVVPFRAQTSIFAASTICTYSGKLDLYNNANQLFDGSGSLVSGWTGINGYASLLLNDFLKIDNNRYGILFTYYDKNDSSSRLYISEYDKRLNGGKGSIVPGRHKIYIGNSLKQLQCPVRRLPDGKFIIILEDMKDLILLMYDYGMPLKYCDTLHIIDHFSLPIIPLGLEKIYNLYKLVITNGLSHSGNTLVLNNSYSLGKHNILTPFYDTFIQHYQTLSAIKIDKQNLKFGVESVIYRDSFYYKTDSIINNAGSDYPEFSPNDSFVYLRNFRKIIGRRSQNRPYDSSIYQFHLNKMNNVYTIPKQTGFGSNPWEIPKLMPDGKLYFIERYRDPSFIYHSYVHCKELPNQLGYSDFKMNIYPLKDIFGATGIGYDYISNRWYDYIKPRPLIDYSCDATVTIKNASDLSLKMDKFTWYLSRTPAGNFEDTVVTFEPIINYTKSGKYPYKVYGYSSAAVYGEWYEDTLFVNIPVKPVAKFLATDTVVCRFLPLQFKNFSYALSKKPNTLPKYVWTFGDGNTSNTFEPTHIYTQPGYYTVSLFFSNGYCDSTLVKNQYIHVVDAPKPGFNVKNNQGCAPFVADFIDTVSLNVTKKEYFFGDSSVWRTISTSKFSYTFQKPGHYWAVQKLYGHTGCIIRTDSVKFSISKGLLPTDSIHINLASYDLDNILHLRWLSHPSSVKYQVYKSPNRIDFVPLIQTNDTFITDAEVPKSQVFYQVKAIDSCGSFSSSQNTVAPSFISGVTINGNESSMINQSLQKGLGLPIKTELLSSFDSKTSFDLLITGPSNPFNDLNFAQPDNLRKCYLLLSEINGENMYSNNFCLDYEPIYFIPNAFSPNGDGLNDKFGPSTFGIESYSMSIYGRWGEKLYSGSEPWHGAFNGQTVMDGVYFYQIFLTENTKRVINKAGVVQVTK